MTVPDTHRIGPQPAPALLIGDAERSEVCELLNQHFTAGRLTLGELQDRLDACVRARTAADLMRLCADLPRLAPPVVAQPTTRTPSPGRDLMFALVMTGVLLAVPMLLLMLLGATILGQGVFLFSLVGGSVAAFVGAGNAFLIMTSRDQARTGAARAAATATPRPAPAAWPAAGRPTR
ncbi:DUF1707 domain-containing protein [Naumannella sp. ID2617S]|nr:DUF1707 domain-containing protein [Naumannella sp. ID2617S]